MTTPDRVQPAPSGTTPSPRTLPALLVRQAERFGDRPFLTIAGAHWRHRDAAPAAARAGAALRAAGIARGDRVALMTGNRVECLETFFGCGWIGAVSVPINTASMGPQIGYVLADSGARLLVVEAAFVERLTMAALAGTALEAIWVVGGESDAVERVGRGIGRSASGLIRIEHYPSRVGGAIDAIAEPADVGPGDTLAILYTSGTTGPAKGVLCPHAQYVAWGANTARILGLRADDVLVTTLPLFHINALNTAAQAAVSGCRVVFEARFSASGFWPAMQAAGATVVYLLGAMVPILLAQPVREAERAHRVRTGLGPGVPASAAEAFEARSGVALIDGYGSTETNFVIAGSGAAAERGTMGRLQPGFDARVVDADDNPLAAGIAGELVLRADAPFAFACAYFGKPEATVEAWRNLWFHTGDRVVRDADGVFRFVDRLKDTIRRRGENISSYEVEQVLLSHPGVAAAAAFPVRSDLAEDEVMVALVAHPDRSSALDPAEVARHCESRLPRFAIPRYIEIVDDLPRTANGKVQKFILRERGVGARTWDRQSNGRAGSGAGAPGAAPPAGPLQSAPPALKLL
jgi:crotonobetaine/carnitine-CoA ligase